MKLRHVAPFAFGLLSTLAVACAPAADDVQPLTSEDAASVAPELTFVPEAVNVDQSFSDAVKVSESSLVIPTAQVGKIHVGSIVAGNRSSNGPTDADNPYGFLRRVTGVERKGGTTTLETERAELSDWILEGRLDFASKKSIFENGVVTADDLSTESLHVLNDPKYGSTGPTRGRSMFKLDKKLSPELAVENAYLTMDAQYEGYFEVLTKLKIPYGVKYKSKLTLSPSVAADIVVRAKGKLGLPPLKAETPGAPILLPSPIPLTLRIGMKMECHLEATAQTDLTIAVNAGVTGVIGFEGKAAINDWSFKNLYENPKLTTGAALKQISGQAVVTTGCSFFATASLLAFDAAGIEGEAGPYAELTATACELGNSGGHNGGFSLMLDEGVKEDLNAKVEIPILGVGPSWSLASFHQRVTPDNKPFYIAGDEKTCTAPLVDSCAGKSDGMHCSEVNSYAGIVCQGGQILKGIQCQEMTQKCTGGSNDEIQCQ